MFSTQSLARRLLYTMFPWYLALALSMTAVQLAIQYVSVTSDIAADLASLGKTVGPTVTEAVWKLDTDGIAATVSGIRQNAIVTGARVTGARGEVLAADGEVPATPHEANSTFPWRDRQQVLPLVYRPPRGEDKLIGYLDMYSSREVAWNRIKYTFLVVLINSVIFTAGLWLIFSWAVRFRLSDSVTRVAKAVSGWRFQREHGGAPVEQIDYPYQDELGDLVHALNESRSRLFDSMKELKDLNRNLESTVALRTQELRQAKDAAEAASRAKGAFLANMSHEIRTPMNAIMGLTHLVLETSLTHKQKDYLQKVQVSSAALLGLLNDILDYSKIEAGQLHLERTEFQLENCLKNVCNLFSGRIEEKGLELFVELDPRVPCRVVGDPLRFEQVLNNLVGNAIKFTEAGEIHVKVDLRERRGDDIVLQVAVKDTGIGLDAAQCERLFQAFAQADTSITRKFGGSGLGLAICRQLVHLMGGDIGVDSEPGRGSTFTFTVHCGAAAAHAAPDRLQQLRPMKSLVVDDHETSRIMLRKLLQSWGFEAQTAPSGRHALEAVFAAEAAGTPFELLLLDWRMPGLSGLDVAQEIARAAQAGRIRRTPVMAMVTAHDKDELLQEAGAAALDSVLTKPVVPSALFDALLHIQSPGQARPTPPGANYLAPRETLARLQGARILLVEDNALNQEVVSEFLGRAGLAVTLAANGQEAVERVRHEPFDAVLMDLHMPVMDGLEATRLIRDLPNGQRLPIFAMTAAAMPQDRDASLAAGMNAHIAKPIDPQELANRLVEWIRPDGGGQPGAQPVISAPQPAAQEDIAQLERALPGVAVRQALVRLHGNAALYRRLLHSFASRHAQSADAIRSCQAPNDGDALFRICHELKSDAGSLGLEDVSQAANELAAGIKEQRHNRIGELADRLARACTQAVATLRASAEVDETDHLAGAAPGQYAPAQLRHQLELLEQQLESRDFGAMPTVDAIEGMLRDTRLVAGFRDVSRQARELRYAEALAALRRFMAGAG
ncbi:hybrid sensor histidine kinase/response regulator [Noviherbaspirillum autotrophicum]|uniref:hybrid sensor histidine kinase/response regulator n=1 Tax=Noviherbaspirillum autotrophicum TaxID=709839 RepID=UPI0006949DE7|nr:response regulator [Noviherbaspirillum autotrophicum]